MRRRGLGEGIGIGSFGAVIELPGACDTISPDFWGRAPDEIYEISFREARGEITSAQAFDLVIDYFKDKQQTETGSLPFSAL